MELPKMALLGMKGAGPPWQKALLSLYFGPSLIPAEKKTRTMQQYEGSNMRRMGSKRMVIWEMVIWEMGRTHNGDATEASLDHSCVLNYRTPFA